MNPLASHDRVRNLLDRIRKATIANGFRELSEALDTAYDRGKNAGTAEAFDRCMRVLEAREKQTP